MKINFGSSSKSCARNEEKKTRRWWRLKILRAKLPPLSHDPAKFGESGKVSLMKVRTYIFQILDHVI